MIYIIRHGQTALNQKQLLQGRSDKPLNEKGIEQARAAAEQFRARGISFDRVYSSPLVRAIQTAEVICDSVPITVDERLIEMDYGPYEGMDLANPAPEITAFFRDITNLPAPAGMEPLPDVVARLGAFLEDIRPVAGESILVSTHAIAMKGALEYLTPDSHGSYWGKMISNCEVYVTELRCGAYTIPVPLA